MDLITRLALKNRLLHVLLGCITLTFLGLSALFAYQQRDALHQELHYDLHSTANLISTNIGGALIYGANWVSEEVFRRALSGDRAVRLAVLYSPDGQELLRFAMADASERSLPAFRLEGDLDSSGHHELFYPIRVGADEAPVGVLFLRASFDPINAQMRNYYLVQLLGLGVILVLTYAFGRRLQRVISAPYLAQQRLLETQVAERTGQLQRAHDRLQAEVEERKQVQKALLHEQQEQLSLIAKLEQAQNQLLQAEKMASIGQLAAGVAHEINNPVGFISSNLHTLEGYIADLCRVLSSYAAADELLRTRPELAQSIAAVKAQVDYDYLLDDLGALLRESKEGLERVRKIVQDLKDFSRSDSKEYQWYDLQRGLDSTLNMASNEIKYRATVTKEYADLPPVYCCLTQINQVVLNLLVNAAQSITGMGSIVLRCGCDGTWAWIEVQDNGCGIPEPQLKRIFDPFYTTKPVGVGTGLGLSLSYGIVRDHGGRIEVRSRVDEGTRFRVWLPVQGPPAARELQAETAENAGSA